MVLNMEMEKPICVYCSSSDAVSPNYFSVAEELGKYIAQHHYPLVYGGGNIGLMGALARSVHQNGGIVIGVIPKTLNIKGIVYESCDELIVTPTMRHRKTVMAERSHAFITMPGGFGTLEEFLEIITLKQLHFHQKPIVLLNVDNFFHRLLHLFDQLYEENFAKQIYQRLYFIAKDIPEAMTYIEEYHPPQLPDKWF